MFEFGFDGGEMACGGDVRWWFSDLYNNWNIQSPENGSLKYAVIAVGEDDFQVNLLPFAYLDRKLESLKYIGTQMLNKQIKIFIKSF